MKVFEAIGKGFKLTKQNLTIIVLFFLFSAVWNLISMPFIGNPQNPSEFKFNPVLVIFGVGFVLINIFFQGGILGALKEGATSGGKASLANFAKNGKKFYVRFLGLGALLVFIFLAIGVTLAIIFSISVAVNNLIVNVITISLATILSIVAMYYLFLLFLSPYTLVVDDVGIIKSLKSSIRFMKKYIWKVAWLLTLLVLIAFGIGLLVGIVAGIIAFAIKGTAFQMVTGILSSAVNAYTTILISAAIITYYCALSGDIQKEEAPEEVLPST